MTKRDFRYEGDYSDFLNPDTARVVVRLPDVKRLVIWELISTENEFLEVKDEQTQEQYWVKNTGVQNV